MSNWRPGEQIGPYTLISKLGRGAFGTVWLSERRTAITTTLVALKIPLDDDIDLDTIQQEANVWVKASGHPNILPIIEANIYDEQVVIASEYAPDGSLESWLQQHGGKAPSVQVAVEINSGILAGLEHLHARKIIHRDLKPANILFQGTTPRLTDFGISRVLESTIQTTMAAGTPAYMAPEAFDGKRNEQTDVWSVGVIFYQLLTGHLPFPADTITQLIRMILSSDPDPLPASVPKPLQEVISRALSKDPLKRYKSAAEMRTAILTLNPRINQQTKNVLGKREEKQSEQRKDQQQKREAEERYRRQEEGRRQKWWGALALRGILAVLFGLGVLLWPGINFMILALLLSAYFLFDGVVTVISGISSSGGTTRKCLLIEGVIGILFGVVGLLWPGLNSVALLYIFAFWAIFTGIAKITMAIRLAGVLSVIFGITLMVLSGKGLLVVWLIGIFGLVFGVSLVARAFRVQGQH